ncbi:11162_t:CDS:2, partial [Gigaspora margarita]
KWLDRTDKELPKINDPQLYDKFLHIINLILLYCQKLKLPQDNKVIQKYEKLKTEINNLPNPNKFVIERSIKFIPKKQKNIIKKNNNTSVPLENLPKWMQQNYNKVIKKGFEIDIEEYNISIENNNFVNIVRGILYELTNVCYNLYNLKNTNPITIKYKKIEESIDNTTNKKQFILELAKKFSLFSNKFDPINYRFKPKLLPYIKRFKNCLTKIANKAELKERINLNHLEINFINRQIHKH